jgi:hypothetical protein
MGYSFGGVSTEYRHVRAGGMAVAVEELLSRGLAVWTIAVVV